MPKSKSRKKTRAKSRSSSHKPIKNGRLIVLVFLLVAILLFVFSMLNPKTVIAPSTSTQPFTVTYEGVTPCADCSGVKTVLTLSYNPNTYVESFTYIGRDTGYIETGTWNVGIQGKNPPKLVYTLIPNGRTGTKTQYEMINGSEIRQLDGNGNEMPENLPFNLKKNM